MRLTLLVSHQFLQLAAPDGSQSLPPVHQYHTRHQQHHCVQHRHDNAAVYQLVGHSEGEVQRTCRHPHRQKALTRDSDRNQPRQSHQAHYFEILYPIQTVRQYQSVEPSESETLRAERLERCNRLISSRNYLNYSSIRRYFSRSYWYSQDQVTACPKDCCSSRTYCCESCSCLASVSRPTLAACNCCCRLYLSYLKSATSRCSSHQRSDRSFCSYSRKIRTYCLAHLSCQLSAACLSCEKWPSNYQMCCSNASLSSSYLCLSALYFQSRFSKRLTSCLLQRISSSIAFLFSRSSASAIFVIPNCLVSISASFLCSSNCCHNHQFFAVSPLALSVRFTFMEIEARLSKGWQRSAISLQDCLSEVGLNSSFSGFSRDSWGWEHQSSGWFWDAEGSLLRDPCRQVSVWTEFFLTNLRDLSGWVSSENVVTLFLPDINIVDFY